MLACEIVLVYHNEQNRSSTTDYCKQDVVRCTKVLIDLIVKLVWNVEIS
jgi:hypothetical protein